MECSHVSAVSMKPWLPSNFPHLSMLKPLNFGFNVVLAVRTPKIIEHNITLAVATKVEAKLRHTPIRRASFLSSLQPCKATSDDSGKVVSGENILLNEQTLERELQTAITQENYGEAARIRDRIRVLHKDSEASILAANARFYNAFRIGDLASMQALWAKGDNVCCVHPGASGISGYDLVMRSWEYVWVDYEFPLEIEPKNVQVHVKGDIGYVTCVELVKTKGNSWGRQFATNVFERVDGQWLICIHHASPVDL